MGMAALFRVASLALPSFTPPPGSVSAVYELLERMIPTGSSHFDLALADSSTNGSWFRVEDGQGRVAITASGTSELASGLGFYLRERCNITIGWPRGGGSRGVGKPPVPWPLVGGTVTQRRAAPISYIMNVCTHSYSLVWYDWPEWEAFLDWAALSGLNMFLALTGQEEVQYKVFQQFGLSDEEIRGWFNGPAFLTWSRGQNEYGAGIAGPLPRSWMRAQWGLQRQILARARSLGMVGQLPACEFASSLWQLRDARCRRKD